MEREAGGGIGMGNTCKSMADSCQCMAKTLQYCKVISLQLMKINGKKIKKINKEKKRKEKKRKEKSPCPCPLYWKADS